MEHKEIKDLTVEEATKMLSLQHMDVVDENYIPTEEERPRIKSEKIGLSIKLINSSILK